MNINIHERDDSSLTRRITYSQRIASDKWSGELIKMKNRVIRAVRVIRAIRAIRVIRVIRGYQGYQT